MLDGFPLRRYRAWDWVLMILTSSLFLQVAVTVYLSGVSSLYQAYLQTVDLPVEELVLMVSYQGAAFGTILSLPLMLLVVYWRKIPLFNRRQLTKEESFIIRGLNREDWRFLVRYIPLSYLLYVGGNVLVTYIFGEAEAVNQNTIEAMFDYIPLWQMFLMIVVVAPIVEELFFRGLMLFPGDKLETTWLRTIISAFLFGLIHTPTNIQSLYTYVAMGFMFSYAGKRTQSVEAPMVYHVLNNMMGFLAILALREML